MDKAVLITRPDHDLITTYLFKYSEKILEVATNKGIKVLDLAGRKANKATLTSYIQKNEPLLVFLNGHGNQDVITGYDNEPLISSGDNEILLKEKIVYARSCDAAENLGKLCIKQNTLTFIGYRRKFTMGYTQSSVTHPLDDKVAQLFLNPSNLVMISLLKGNTAGDSFRKSQEAMVRTLSFMLSTKASQEQSDAAPYLWQNRKYQVLLGESNARL